MVGIRLVPQHWRHPSGSLCIPFFNSITPVDATIGTYFKSVIIQNQFSYQSCCFWFNSNPTQKSMIRCVQEKKGECGESSLCWSISHCMQLNKTARLQSTWDQHEICTTYDHMGQRNIKFATPRALSGYVISSCSSCFSMCFLPVPFKHTKISEFIKTHTKLSLKESIY